MDRLLIWHWSRYQPLLTHPDSELCFVIRCDMILNGFRNARKPMNSTIECGHGAGSSGQLGITTRKHMTSRPSTSARRILVLNWQWGGLRLCLGGERSDRYCTKRTVQSFLCYLRRQVPRLYLEPCGWINISRKLGSMNHPRNIVTSYAWGSIYTIPTRAQQPTRP